MPNYSPTEPKPGLQTVLTLVFRHLLSIMSKTQERSIPFLVLLSYQHAILISLRLPLQLCTLSTVLDTKKGQVKCISRSGKCQHVITLFTLFFGAAMKYLMKTISCLRKIYSNSMNQNVHSFTLIYLLNTLIILDIHQQHNHIQLIMSISNFMMEIYQETCKILEKWPAFVIISTFSIFLFNILKAFFLSRVFVHVFTSSLTPSQCPCGSGS